MISGVPGFENAPISKALLFATCFLSSFTWIFNIKDFFILSSSNLFSLQLWRIITFHFIFQNIGEMLFGLILLYYMRTIERIMGSTKFASMIISSLFISFFFIICVFLFVGSQSTGTSIYFSGPHSIILSFMPIAFYYIPTYHKFKFFGIPFSDKSFIYLFCIQLLFNNFPSSFLNGIFGLIFGIIYSHESSGLAKFLLPKSISVFCKNHFEQWIIDPYQPNRAIEHRNEISQRRIRPMAQQRNRENNQHVNQQHMNQPSDQNINALMDMGFARDVSFEALLNSNNDLNEAINQLLLN